MAGDFIYFVEADPCESDQGRSVFEVEGRLHCAEGVFATSVDADDDLRLPAEVEIVAIPEVGLDDPPSPSVSAIAPDCRPPRRSDPFSASEARLLLSGDGLDPVKAFFDLFADALADGVAHMARRAAVDRRGAPVVVLHGMRRDLHRAQFVDEIVGVIGLVGAQCDGPRPIGVRLDQVNYRDALGVAVRRRPTGADDGRVPVRRLCRAMRRLRREARTLSLPSSKACQKSGPFPPPESGFPVVAIGKARVTSAGETFWRRDIRLTCKGAARADFLVTLFTVNWVSPSLTRALWADAVSHAVNPVGKPYAGNPRALFDESRSERIMLDYIVFSA